MALRLKTEEDWERIRQRGHKRWVLVTGPLAFGLPLFLVIGVYVVIAHVFFSTSPPAPWADWVASAVLMLVMAYAAGYIWADWVWHRWSDRTG